MGFLDSFFGKSQARDINAANTEATGMIRGGYAQAGKDTRAGYDQAFGYLDPYMQSGGKASQLYDDAIGLGNYDNAFAQFNADPFRQGMQDQAGREADRLFRRYNPTGQGGTSQLAVTRMMGDRYATDVGDFRNRLQGRAGQGQQMAQMGAGMATDRGNTLAGLATGQATTLAGNRINYGNALAANRNTGFNNILGIAGLATNAYGASMGVPKKGRA